MERARETEGPAWTICVLSTAMLAVSLLYAGCSDRPSGDIHPAKEEGVKTPLRADDGKKRSVAPQTTRTPTEEDAFQDEDDRDDADRDEEE